MRVYLAASYSRKKEIFERAEHLRSLGVEVTSTWMLEPHSPNSTLGELPFEEYVSLAERDLEEINEADTIILFTQDPTKPFVRGGRMHEFGYAHASSKRLIIIGPRENIFHYLPIVEVHHSWESFTRSLKNA
jgi:nucleoside 2-deoxyribosyltransferase